MSPRKKISQQPTPNANNKIIKDRLGLESLSEIDELVIQMQGYAGEASVNAGNLEGAPR